MTGPREAFYRSFPELKQYSDKIYLLFASSHFDHSLIERSTIDVVNEIREARKNGKTKIVFFNSSETFLPNLLHKSQRIAEILKEIDRKDLIYSVGSPDGQEYYDQWVKQHGYENRFNVICSHHFEFFIHKFANELANICEVPEYEVGIKDKLFVCFNKLHRTHRLRFLAESIRNEWLDKTYFSFEGAHPNWLEEMTRFPISDHDKHTILSIKDKFPLRLEGGVSEDRPNPVDLRPDDLIYHENSYFSVVNETIFGPFNPRDGLLHYADMLFLSEKIYKPFAFRHPFILVGWHGGLKMLRERGYKTFHPYINESYDDEPDHNKRFDMIIEEIKRLEKFTDDQWIEWQHNIKSIVEYNYKYLLNLKDHRVGAPVDHLFKD
jgi:hypothetical protein